MKKQILDLRVKSVEQLGFRYSLIKLTSDESLPTIYPGQFVEVRVDHSSHTFLRRPISVNFVDVENRELWLLVAQVGHGTRQLSKLVPGEFLNCLLPLGNHFTIPTDINAKVLLIGGGVGVAPLLYYGKVLHDKKYDVTFLLGAKSKDDLVEKELFEQYGEVCITTEDGSLGEKGYVTNHSVLQKRNLSYLATCGPKPMMLSVARYAHAHKIVCEVSLENKMACGLGACLCCVEKTKDGNVCVCKEGPVLNINKLLWQL